VSHRSDVSDTLTASDPPPAEAPACPFPHGEGGAPHPTGAHHAGLPQDGGACPVTGAAAPAAEADHPRWTPDADTLVKERAEGWSHGEARRAEELARGVAEERAAGRQAEITALFLRTLGKKLGYGHPLSEKGEELRFTWTEEAEARLAGVPEFCRELTRWRVEWTAHKLGLGTTITPHEMEVKFELWGRVSHAIQERERDGLPWTDSAVDRFSRVPEFVRGQVLEAIEGNARTLGETQVDDAVVDRVIERWITTGDFHEGLYGFR
jgi:hypothetical protein